MYVYDYVCMLASAFLCISACAHARMCGVFMCAYLCVWCTCVHNALYVGGGGGGVYLLTDNSGV